MPRKSSTPSAHSAEAAPGRRVYVLDTNVLMHDPAAIFRFEEHDIYLPMVVLEELDTKEGRVRAGAQRAAGIALPRPDHAGRGQGQHRRGLPIPSALVSGGSGKAATTGRIFSRRAT